MIQNCSTWRVFKEFAQNPTTPYQIRQLSRNVRLAPTSIRKHVKELEKNKLIKKKRVGVYDAYIANFNNEEFRFYKKMVNLVELHQSQLIHDLENKATPDTIILFGSYAKGEDTEQSDIDIFIQAKEKKIDLKKYKLQRKIHLHFVEDIKRLPKELQNNVGNGIILHGFVRWT